jgi:flagellar biosynthetic protein FliP
VFTFFTRQFCRALIIVVALAAVFVTTSAPVDAAVAPTAQTQPAPVAPTEAVTPAAPANNDASVNLDLGGATNSPSNSITILILLTLISLSPSLLVMMTSFTRIVVVLSLTRNALGLQSIPPNQVVVGLALFLSFFVMAPTLSELNKVAVQPYTKGEITQSQAFEAAQVPVKKFMLAHTREPELKLFLDANKELPETAEDVTLTPLIPAFILSELKTAFIIGFVIFVPFLVIDLVISASLMSMGMMMLPPTLIALPFKLLLFVLVDGWTLVAKSLLKSFQT